MGLYHSCDLSTLSQFLLSSSGMKCPMGKVKETKRRREKKPQQEGKIIHVCMAVKGFHIHCFLFLIVISVEVGALMIPTLQMKELRLRGVNGACFLSQEVVESRFKTTSFLTPC